MTEKRLAVVGLPVANFNADDILTDACAGLKTRDVVLATGADGSDEITRVAVQMLGLAAATKPSQTAVPAARHVAGIILEEPTLEQPLEMPEMYPLALTHQNLSWDGDEVELAFEAHCGWERVLDLVEEQIHESWLVACSAAMLRAFQTIATSSGASLLRIDGTTSSGLTLATLKPEESLSERVQLPVPLRSQEGAVETVLH